MKEKLKNRWLPFFPSIAKHLGFPRAVVVEPTNRCNLKCPFCLRLKMTRPVGDMSFGRFKQFFDSVPTLKLVHFYFMGEPLLNREVFQMIRYAEKHGVRTVLETNSTLLNENVEDIFGSGLSKLVCSLDGMSQHTLEKYRVGADFVETVTGIKNVLQYKHFHRFSKPYVKIRFLAFRHNEHEIVKAFVTFQHSVDEFTVVRAILDWNHPYLPKQRWKWLPRNRLLWRYKPDGSLLEPLRTCTWIWTPIITWDGEVLPCCYDYNAEYSLGNVFETSFMEIYWSGRYNSLRKKMVKKQLPLCGKCKQVKHPEVRLI